MFKYSVLEQKWNTIGWTEAARSFFFLHALICSGRELFNKTSCNGKNIFFILYYSIWLALGTPGYWAQNMASASEELDFSLI